MQDTEGKKSGRREGEPAAGHHFDATANDGSSQQASSQEYEDDDGASSIAEEPDAHSAESDAEGDVQGLGGKSNGTAMGDSEDDLMFDTCSGGEEEEEQVIVISDGSANGAEEQDAGNDPHEVNGSTKDDEDDEHSSISEEPGVDFDQFLPDFLLEESLPKNLLQDSGIADDITDHSLHYNPVAADFQEETNQDEERLQQELDGEETEIESGGEDGDEEEEVSHGSSGISISKSSPASSDTASIPSPSSTPMKRKSSNEHQGTGSKFKKILVSDIRFPDEEMLRIRERIRRIHKEQVAAITAERDESPWLTSEVGAHLLNMKIFAAAGDSEDDEMLKAIILRSDSKASLEGLVRNLARVFIGRKTADIGKSFDKILRLLAFLSHPTDVCYDLTGTETHRALVSFFTGIKMTDFM